MALGTSSTSRALMASAAPRSRAQRSFSSLMSTAITTAPSRAPTWTAFSPTPPQPKMATVSPPWTRARLRSPWNGVVTASEIIEASTSGISSGSRKHSAAGATTYSAKAPSRSLPNIRRRSQALARPTRQARQALHGMIGGTSTRSPGLKPSTSAPASATTPEASWPRISGGALNVLTPWSM